MAELGTAYVDIEGDFKNLNRSMKSGFSKAAKIAAGAFIAGFVIKKAFDFGGQLVRQAEEYGSLVAAVDTSMENQQRALGDAATLTTSHLVKQADAVQDLTGISNEQVLAGQQQLVTFHKIQNEGSGVNAVFDRTVGVLADMTANQTFTDMRSGAVQLGKAIGDPVAGITALSRAGVIFTDQQKDQIKTLVESGDTLGAQKLILDELENQYGGVGEATKDSTAVIANAWNDVQVMLGEFLLPVVAKIADFVTKTALPAFRRFGDWFKSEALPAIGRFGDWLSANLMPILTAFAAWFVDVALPAIQSFAAWLATNLTPVFQTLATWIQETALPALQAFADFFINEILARVVPVVETLATFLLENLVPALTAFGDFFNRFRDPIIAFIAAIVTAVVVWKAIAVATRLWAAAQAVLNVIMSLNPIGLVIIAIAAFVAMLVLAYQKVGWFRDFVKKVFGFLTDLWDRWGDDVIRIFKMVWGVVVSVVKVAINVIKTVISVAVAAIRWIWDNFGASIMAVIKFAWGFIKNYVTTVINIVRGIIQVVTSLIKGDWQGVWDGIKNILSAAWEFIRTAVKLGIDLIWTLFKELPGKILRAIGGLGKLLWDSGVAMIQGLIDGIKNMAGKVVSAIKNFVLDKIPGFVKNFFGISSPSKMMAGFGRDVSEGMAVGIIAGAESVEKAMASLAVTPDLTEAAALGTTFDDVHGGLMVTNNFNAPVGGSMATFAKEIAAEGAREMRFAYG